VSTLFSNSALIAFFLFFIVDDRTTKQERKSFDFFIILPIHWNRKKAVGFFFSSSANWRIALAYLFAARVILSCSNSSAFHLENESITFRCLSLSSASPKILLAASIARFATSLRKRSKAASFSRSISMFRLLNHMPGLLMGFIPTISLF